MADERSTRPAQRRNEQTAEQEPVSTDDARQAEVILDRPRRRWTFGIILGAGVVAVFILAAVLG